MRLDKFLKVSRIIKRRPIAKLVIDGGKAKINGKIAKSGSEVKIGQILELKYFDKYFKFEILEVPNGDVKKEKAGELVKVIDFKGIEIDFANKEEIF